MSEKISSEEQIAPVGVVELGSASTLTRGSPSFIGILDGGIIWPLLFWY